MPLAGVSVKKGAPVFVSFSFLVSCHPPVEAYFERYLTRMPLGVCIEGLNSRVVRSSQDCAVARPLKLLFLQTHFVVMSASFDLV